MAKETDEEKRLKELTKRVVSFITKTPPEKIVFKTMEAVVSGDEVKMVVIAQIIKDVKEVNIEVDL